MELVREAVAIQKNVSIILEAKAAEAEKLRSWICNHIHDHTFDDNTIKLQQAMIIHEQVLAMIEGITGMNQGIVGIMNTTLSSPNELVSSFGMESYGSTESGV